MTAYLFASLIVPLAEAASQPPIQYVQPQAQAAECCAHTEDVEFGAASAFGKSPQFLATPSMVPADPSDELLQHDETGAATVGGGYDAGVLWRQAKSIPWRSGGATAAIAATGFANWDWGSSSFRFNSEGWFGKDTASLGMDKLGHAYSAYVLSEFFADGIEHGHPRHRAYTGALLSMGLMTAIEVFDGFSAEHGFSYEDLVVDAAGAAFSVVRRAVPGLREKLDFRLLYVPSRSTWRAISCFPKPHCDRYGAIVRSPITDYTRQKYLLAFKLSGFERFQRTPLRLVELQGGYYARGFTREEEARGHPLRRRLFIGVGLNVGELLFPGRSRGFGRAATSVLEYLQVPYTAVHSH